MSLRWRLPLAVVVFTLSLQASAAFAQPTPFERETGHNSAACR